MKPAMTPQQRELTSDTENGLSLYRKLAVADASLLYFLGYEMATVGLANLPGIVGFGARALVYPLLFRACGRRPAVGRGVVLRQPNRIRIGNKVLIDDYAALDVRGTEGRISLGDFVSIGRYSTITAKNGAVHLSDGVNVGSYTRIATQSNISIGESTLIAAYCYIGPGNHQRGDGDDPLIARDMEIKGGVTIGKHCWIGAGALILDGVTVGDGAIVGAQALVKENVPAGATVVGSPARLIHP